MKSQRKIVKRTLALLLVLLLGLALPGLPAFADGPQDPAVGAAAPEETQAVLFNDPEDTTWQGDYTYTQDDVHQVITLTKYNGTDAAVTIPATATIGGTAYSVALQGDVFSENTALTSVTAEEGVKITDSAEFMFDGCTSLTTADLAGMDTRDCTSVEYMFIGCESLTTLDLSGWDTSQCTNMSLMFIGCESLTTLNMSGWDMTANTTSSDERTPIACVLDGCDNLEELDASGWKTPKDMSAVFAGKQALRTLDVSGWDLSECEDMHEMFRGCSRFETVTGLSGWNTSSCTDMKGLFDGCSSLQALDLSGWNTSKCVDMQEMFHDCSSLETLTGVSGWNTSSCTNMKGMFNGCSSLQALDLSGWNTSNCVNMQEMFSRTDPQMALNVSGFDLTKLRQPSPLQSQTDVENGGLFEMFYGGPLALAGNKLGNQKPSYFTGSAERCIGYDYTGNIGILRSDNSVDRVWCLNFGKATPDGNFYTEVRHSFADELEELEKVTHYTEDEGWKKIIAAIKLFGDEGDVTSRWALQYTIWHYSDPNDFSVENDGEEYVLAREYISEVEERYRELDYRDVVVHYYAPEDNQYQNLLSIETVKTVRFCDMKISKVIEGEADRNTEQVFTFTVTLTNADGTPYTQAVTVQSEGQAIQSVTPNARGQLTVTTVGEGYATVTHIADGARYTVAEAAVSGWHQSGSRGTSGSVSDTKPAEVVFTNGKDRYYYEAGAAQATLQVTKSFNDWSKAQAFTFVLAAVDGAPLPESTTATATQAQPTASFGAIEYAAEGVYRYTITEQAGNVPGVIYDTAAHPVTVTVTADEQGALVAAVDYDGARSLTVTNTYAAAQAVLKVTKKYDHWGEADQFQFRLAAVEDAPLPAETVATATKEQPVASFAAIGFPGEGVYRYTITEVAGDLPGVTYDTAAHPVTVNVTADREGGYTVAVDYDGAESLTVTNTFAGVFVELKATKQFNDWSKAAEFLFDLAAVNGAPLPESTTARATREAPTAVFGKIFLDKAGVYEYTITERNTKLPGVTYDTKAHKVAVTVTRSDGGAFVAAVTYDGAESLTITNTYAAGTAPKTGDGSEGAFWLGLLVVSAAGLVALRLTGRRKKPAHGK